MSRFKQSQTGEALNEEDLRSLGGLDFLLLEVAGAGFEPATFGL